MTAEMTLTTRTTNTLSQRTVPTVLPIRTLPMTVQYSTCGIFKRSILYPRAGGSNCNKERHLQCTGLRRSEREAIRDGDHIWACCVANVGPSIVQRNNIDPLRTEVTDEGIRTGNGNDEVVPNLVRGRPVPNALGM